MLIDSHVHLWKANPEFPASAASVVGPQTPVHVELLDEYLDEYSVPRAVLVQPMYAGTDNSYIADAARKRPDRFAAVCVVDPRRSDADEQLEYWTRERGCRGLRLRPRFSEESAVFGDPSTYPLWKKAAELGVVISVLADAKHLPTLQSLALMFPTVSIVVDHLAHPDPSLGRTSPEFLRLLSLAECRNIWVKISGYYHYSRQAYPYEDCHELFRDVFDRFGAERTLWGSDFPHAVLKTTYGRTLRVPNQALPQLSPENHELIYGGNSLMLYWR